jgi:EmrB/QacA subfamily drug resistance transporter
MGIFDSPDKRAALLVFTTSSFLTPFMASSIEIALPSIGRHFALDAVLLSWIATAFLLSAAMFLVPFGRLADIYGRKRVFVIGISVYTVFSFCCGAATSSTMLLAGRVLQGIGSAMIFGTGIAILTSVFPAHERGKVLGINVAAVYAGLSGGPFLGGILVGYLGWRSIFFANLPVGMLIIAIVAWRLKGEWAEARGERFDIFGSIVYGLSLVCLMYGFSSLPEALGIGLIAAGIAGLVLFVRWELKTSSPVFNMDLFRRNITFAFSNLAALINYSATYAITFMLSLYLQYTRGYGAEAAGVILVSRPIVMVLISLYAGRLSDRIEPRIVASLGMALVTVGLIMLMFLGAATPIGYLVLCLVVLGLGFGFFSSPNTNAVMSSVERRFYGVASGTVGTMRLLGQMFSMGIVTLIFALHLGRVEITPATLDQFQTSMHIAFAIFTILCFVGIFFSLARGQIRKVETPETQIP